MRPPRATGREEAYERSGGWGISSFYPPIPVSPAKAGVHTGQGLGAGPWIPAFAGKTVNSWVREVLRQTTPAYRPRVTVIM